MIYRLITPLAVMLLVLFTAVPAMAGTHSLGTPVDDSSDANVPVTDHPMITIPTSASGGGNDATSATVSINGSVALADVAEIAIFYQALEVARSTISGLSNQVISLPGNQKGKNDWTFFISLNSSAGGKTFGLTVESIAGTNNANLPFSTTIRNATGATTPQEINVYYQTTPAGDIVDGDSNPSVAKGTDFDNSPVSQSVDSTFRIENKGDDNLTLDDPSPYVTVTGADFSLLTPYPTTPVTGGTYTEFTVRFTPSTTGLRTGTVSILNNDSDETTYNFDIQGTGTAPEINVYYQATPSGDIPDGDTTPLPVKGTDFENSPVTVSVDHTFRIENTGNDNLTLDDPSPYVTVTGADFSLVTPYPITPVTGGTYTEFTVRFTPSTTGLRTGTVSILNNDSSETIYNFDIQGTGTPPAPEINVYYQSTPSGDVADGDITPTAVEGNEFGNSPVTVSVDHTFTIQNTGTADLNLTDLSPYVTVTGADFALITPYPTTPVSSGGGSTTFTVRFTPSSTGLKTGTVSIGNDDSSENPYNFNIQGTGTAPEMNVYYLSTPSGDVADDDITPSAAEGSEFGSAGISTNVDHIFTIQNTGTADLNLTGSSPYVIVTGADFTLITPYPSTPVTSGGGTTTFTVRFSPSSTGLKTGTVSVTNDDSDENPYNFDIQGTGTAPSPTVTSPSASTIEDITATLGGTVTFINGTSIVERGIYWSTTQGFTPPGQGTQVSTTGSWTGTPMPFTENVTGLPSGQVVYFQAFAINDIGGEGYTAESSFQTEPSGQPTNLQFSDVVNNAMWISWDGGDGDGVIVVVKEGSAVDVGTWDPLDGTEYPFNSEFGDVSTDLGNGNYVVYRGPANTVFMLGLTGDTTYYVAVYEYAGAGSGINYQQHSPLQDSQLTTTTPLGHNNSHNITNCDQCHALHTGTTGIVPHDAAQETVCKTCHNSTQMAGFPEKWDVGMHEVTTGGARTIDCGSCHEVHNGYNFDTVDTHIDGVTAPNLSRIRQDTSKYVAGALEPAIFQTDPDHFAFAEASGSQSGAPWNGICQSCHTNASLKWHTNGSQASEANPHDHNKVGAQADPNCMSCHSHSAGFPTPTCFSCHSAAQDNSDSLPVGGAQGCVG